MLRLPLLLHLNGFWLPGFCHTEVPGFCGLEVLASCITAALDVCMCAHESQKTLNHLAWTVILLNAMRTPEQREREVLSASKLQPNDEGKSKGGAGVAVEHIQASPVGDIIDP